MTNKGSSQRRLGFDARLSAETSLSDSPWLADGNCAWDVRVWLMPRPVSLQKDEPFEIYYRHSVPGKRDLAEIRKLSRDAPNARGAAPLLA